MDSSTASKSLSHKKMYPTIEDLISWAVEEWNLCLCPRLQEKRNMYIIVPWPNKELELSIQVD